LNDPEHVLTDERSTNPVSVYLSEKSFRLYRKPLKKSVDFLPPGLSPASQAFSQYRGRGLAGGLPCGGFYVANK